MSVLPRSFFERSALVVARELVGMVLVCEREGRRRAGVLVETEAYLGPKDKASHASKGRTARTAVMFGPPGHAYVFLVYGMHRCMNAVTGPDGKASAVLLRGLQPLWEPEPGERTDGPGRLTRALAIELAHGGADLCAARSPLRIEAGRRPARGAVARGPRVGVDYAGEWAARPYRFYLRGNAHVSAPRD